MALLVELADEVPQRLTQLHIHTSRGLVEHDDGRLVHQGLRHQHTALHAARELAHIGMCLVGQPQTFQQLVNPGVIVFDAKVAGLQAQGFAHIEERVKHQFLRHHPQLLARGGKVFLHMLAHDRDMAATGLGQTGKQADEGGLARAIGAEQTEELALGNVQAHVLECLKITFGAGVSLGDRLDGDSWHGNPTF